jgi:sugar (pentulose or hexulose) kinase
MAKGLLNDQVRYEDFTAEGAKASIGADGMLFLPNVTNVNGERAPLWNPKARGAFFGMSIGHQKQGNEPNESNHLLYQDLCEIFPPGKRIVGLLLTAKAGWDG